ncbi:Crp/Fnr family transcriptional regulator [Aeromonas hydrophila]|uniref:Crp/Fnr family transcriptional regulator n=1 Tax=Aeromonas hydrophila TaxID=644 RepID=UPI002B477CA8|nr:helix-turn-helix domain-containing protein [Aeromonas hydrophila]
MHADIAWPCSLHPSTQASLLALAKPFDCQRLTGSLPGVLYVSSGCLVTYAANASISNSLGLIFGRGCWLGTQSIHNPAYAPSERNETLLPTELLLFPRADIESLSEQEPEVFKFLFHIAQQVVRISLQMGSNTLFCLTTRIVYVLLELVAKNTAANTPVPSLNITQQRLSQITGISRPRVNEVLKELARTGEITIRRSELNITDMAALKARLHPFSLMYYDPVPHIQPPISG